MLRAIVADDLISRVVFSVTSLERLSRTGSRMSASDWTTGSNVAPRICGLPSVAQDDNWRLP